MPEDFGVSISKFVAGLKTKAGQLQTACEQEVLASIKHGSAITGSRGQPVDTGFLQESWKLTRQGSARAVVSSNCAYAEVIEQNDRAFYRPEGAQRDPALPHRDGGTQWVKSTVGQNHAVATTIAGWPAIVSHFNATRIRASDLSDGGDT